MTNPNIAEKRNLKRWHLLLYLRVFDQQTGKQLGNIIDISETGLMLISDQPLPVDRDYDLWMEIPKEDQGREKLQLKAHSRWCDHDANPDFYNTGFQLLNVDSDTLNKIQQLMLSLTY